MSLQYKRDNIMAEGYGNRNSGYRVQLRSATVFRGAEMEGVWRWAIGGSAGGAGKSGCEAMQKGTTGF